MGISLVDTAAAEQLLRRSSRQQTAAVLPEPSETAGGELQPEQRDEGSDSAYESSGDDEDEASETEAHEDKAADVYFGWLLGRLLKQRAMPYRRGS